MESEIKYAGILGIILVLVIGGLIVLSIPKAQENNIDLKKFNSVDELRNYLEINADKSAGNSIFNIQRGAVSEDVSVASADSSSAGSSAQADSYSQTNIQVAGVDEPDFVKNDGKYIYQILQDNKVAIIDAYPASNMKIITELEFDNNVAGLFIYKKKLIVIEAIYGYYNYGNPELTTDLVVSSNSVVSPNNPEVRVHIYNLIDITKPKLEDTFVSKGNYYTARMINGHVYLISNYNANSNILVFPEFSSNSDTKEIKASDIYYPIVSDSMFLFTSVLSIDVEELDFRGEAFLTGNSGVTYVSKNALYLTNQEYFNYQDFQEDIILDVYVPLLPSNFKSEIEEILKGNNEFYIKTQEIEKIFGNYYNALKVEEKDKLEKDLQKKINEFASDWFKKYQKTIIHKIELDGLDISYSGTGKVPGYLLNQFSLDESKGNLRVATTTGQLWFVGDGNSGNNLYVLNSDLEIIGSVEDLAPGERIYSTRFVGDKAYMVTFRQVDPLYVIDISNPKKPEVLGYLKVTGFSNYLHPYDENTLIGIGHEATDEGRVQGVKISLFDVSDFENPMEIDKYIVKGDWSNSEAEYEHKAVLFDRKKGILVIPVSYSNYRENFYDYWQGAFVFDVNNDSGEVKLKLRGKISHNEDTGNGKYFYWYDYVRRSIFMDDVLYTISYSKIKANDLESLEDINSIEFEIKKDNLYY